MAGYDSTLTGAEVQRALAKAESSVQCLSLNGEKKAPDAEGIIDLGDVGGSSAACKFINVSTSGDCQVSKDVANIVTFNIPYNDVTEYGLCAFTFADAPDYSDIISGKWAEYKVRFFYDRGVMLSFGSSVAWAESCGAPTFEVGYVYEFSFEPFVAEGITDICWIGVWSKSRPTQVLPIILEYDIYNEAVMLRTDHEIPIQSDIQFVFGNGLIVVMPSGSYEWNTGLETNAQYEVLMVLGTQSGLVVKDASHIYLLVKNL